MQVREFNSDDIYAAHAVAKTILSQISLPTKMACGIREIKVIGIESGHNRGVQFRVNGGTKRQFIKVVLQPNDTYTVISYRLKRVTDEHIEIVDLYDIYCDQLSEIIYHMVNK